jgi:hypothetical protein
MVWSRRRGKNIELRQPQSFILIPPAHCRMVGTREVNRPFLTASFERV